MHFLKHLDRVAKIITGLSYLFCLFFPFLCKGVTYADLRHEGKVEDLIELFMISHKNLAKISTFCFIILVGISELSDALFIFKLRISFSILIKSISSKASFIPFLILF